jgi:hypothetical protein
MSWYPSISHVKYYQQRERTKVTSFGTTLITLQTTPESLSNGLVETPYFKFWPYCWSLHQLFILVRIEATAAVILSKTTMSSCSVTLDSAAVLWARLFIGAHVCRGHQQTTSRQVIDRFLQNVVAERPLNITAHDRLMDPDVPRQQLPPSILLKPDFYVQVEYSWQDEEELIENMNVMFEAIRAADKPVYKT